MSYGSALRLQQLLADRHKPSTKINGIHDMLVLLEHFLVYTVGSDQRITPKKLKTSWCHYVEIFIL
jgi:lipoate-protein ligase B